MRTILGSLSFALVSALVSAQETAPPAASTAAMGQLSRSATMELEKSSRDLQSLRGNIAADKVPLAEELTALEEKLTQLRRDHDQATRLVDASNLEAPVLEAQMKARQDELAYVGNLLDEYVRTFESKANVSELQQCGAAIETAKQATEDAALTRTEKFERQLSFASLSVQRLFDAVGGVRFQGTGVDMQGTVIEGTFALIGPIALFSAANGGPAGLVVPQSGSTKPLIRPLEGVLQAGIASLVEAGEGLLPLDPSRGGALKALVQKTNLMHVFEKGGPIMWPLLFASILALGTVIERLVFLLLERLRRDPKALDLFFAAVGKGHIDEAIRIGNASKFYVVRALSYALGHREQSLASAVLYAQAKELGRWRRGIPILDTVITLAPLLGLLGTVVGMMGSFSLIGGDLDSPGAITGGIAEALIATAFGLGIAITCLLPFNFLNTKMEDARIEIESAATQLELLLPASALVGAAPTAARIGAHEVVAQDASQRSSARDEALRRKVELRHERELLQRQMSELQRTIDLREQEARDLAERERGLQQVVLQPRAIKD